MAIGRKVVFGLAGATAAGAGATNALTDAQGPYRQEVLPIAQDMIFGDPYAMQTMARASIMSSVSGTRLDDITPSDSHNRLMQQRRSNSGGLVTNAPGELVFGQYNSRRGR